MSVLFYEQFEEISNPDNLPLGEGGYHDLDYLVVAQYTVQGKKE